jgi:CBS domain-containing protein
MKLNQLMTKDVVTIRPDDSVATAAKKMRDRNIGFLPVCDGDRLVGTLTDRDITVNAVADGKDPKATHVRDLVHSDVFWCFEDQDVRDAARIMEENRSTADGLEPRINSCQVVPGRPCCGKSESRLKFGKVSEKI